MEAPKLKSIAITLWRAGGMDTLVKVMPIAYRPDPNMTVGSCTSFKYVVGRTPEEMGRILGLRTKLTLGASVYIVRPLPAPAEFELRGYTHTPGGMATDDSAYVPHAEYPPGFGAPEWHLTRVPQSRLVHLADAVPGVVLRFRVADLPRPT